MATESKYTSITLNTETYQMLQSIRSCYQLKNRKSISFSDLINKYVMAGISAEDPALAQIMDIIRNTETIAQTNEQDNQE